MNRLKLLVVGAGATGGYFGALAVRGGADVTFVARGPHGAAMRERGVVVRGGDGKTELEARPRVVAALAELAPAERFDCVLVMVKTGDLAGVLPACAARCADGGVVLLGQNGIDVETQAAPHVPAERLAGGVLIINAWVPEPGVVAHQGPTQIIMGVPAGAPPAAADAAQRAAAALTAAGVPASYTGDLQMVRWVKLVWNNAWNVLTTLTGLTVGAAARTPELRALAAAAMRETAAVAAAAGVKLQADIVEFCLMQADMRGDVQTSMLQDRLAGRPLEAYALCGVIVERGKQLGVPTPVNDVWYPLLLGVSAAVAPGRTPG